MYLKSVRKISQPFIVRFTKIETIRRFFLWILLYSNCILLYFSSSYDIYKIYIYIYKIISYYH